MKALCCLLLVLSLGAADGGPPIRPRSARVGPTPEAERLLRIAEDEVQPYSARVEALDQLGERREPATVPRLLRLLPGEGDVVTLRAVIALGKIGDRRALPALRKIRDDPDQEFPGKINTALEGTIRYLEKR
jgi:HEAT repeats